QVFEKFRELAGPGNRLRLPFLYEVDQRLNRRTGRDPECPNHDAEAGERVHVFLTSQLTGGLSACNQLCSAPNLFERGKDVFVLFRAIERRLEFASVNPKTLERSEANEAHAIGRIL